MDLTHARHVPESGRVPTGDGAELHYTRRGDQSGASARVVLIHALAVSEEVWAPVAERLAAAGASVLTYDCRGHGASTRVPGPYSLALFARDLAALMDAVHWPSAVVAGVSMGGSVAQEFAAAYPERVEALGLVNTTAWYGIQATQYWGGRARQAEEQGLQGLVDFQLGRWFSDTFRAEHPHALQRFTELFLANDVHCYAASCEMLGAFDLRKAIRGIRAPTAVVVGDEDIATPPEMARQLHEAIAGSTLHVLTGARHLTPLERPDEVATILRALAERSRGSATGPVPYTDAGERSEVPGGAG